MSTLILLTQSPNLNTSVVGMLGPQVNVHYSCPNQSHYGKERPRKKHKYLKRHQNNQPSTCVAYCANMVLKVETHSNEKQKPNTLYRSFKPPTEDQIKQRIERQEMRTLLSRIGTPPRVTNVSYEELKLEHPIDDIDKYEKATQLTCSPLEVPAEPKRLIGFDQSTHVTWRDLIDWDEDATTVVEIVVGKITQQTLMELCHEEELYKLQTRYHRLQEIQDEREAEEKNVVEKEMGQIQEAMHKLEEQYEKKIQMNELARRVGANVESGALIREVLPAVLDEIQYYGIHMNELFEEINFAFTRSLTEAIGIELDDKDQDILMRLIKDEVQQRYDVYTQPETNVRTFPPMNNIRTSESDTFESQIRRVQFHEENDAFSENN